MERGITEEDQVRSNVWEVYASCLHQLTRGLAHDLNGALNSLSLNVELLRLAAGSSEDAGEREDAERAAAAVGRAVRSMQETIRTQLLPIGAIEAEKETDAVELATAFAVEMAPLLHLHRTELEVCGTSGTSVRCAAPAARRVWAASLPGLLAAFPAPRRASLTVSPAGADVSFRFAVESSTSTPGNLDGLVTAVSPSAPASPSRDPRLAQAWAELGGALLETPERGGGPSLDFRLPRA
jgi:hypothetical protein